MSRDAQLALLGLVTVLHAAAGCSAYSEGASSPQEVTPAESHPLAAATNLVREAALEPVPTTKPAAPAIQPKQPEDKTMRTEPEPPVDMPGTPTPLPTQDTTGYLDLRVERSSRFDGYLTDDFGRALYMFVGDVAGNGQSACLGDCALEWPPFSHVVVSPSPELDPGDIARIHRDDGMWQTTYKGHALYYRASELGVREVTGDGVDERWFVARDYLVFLAAARTFTPAGGTTVDDSFLTDGFGRALYICLDDQPSTALREAISSCDATCSIRRPSFTMAEPVPTTRVPSVLDPSELVRPDGQPRLTYRGWPLYLYSGDAVAGSTAGHNDRAWRAIDPVSFGLTDP